MEQGSRATRVRGARLRSSSDIKRVFQNSRRADGALFTLLVAARPAAGPPRLGLVVSRRVGGAVVRNRVKRMLRVAFRRVPPAASVDVVFMAKPPLARAALDDVERAYAEQIRLALRRLARPRQAGAPRDRGV